MFRGLRVCTLDITTCCANTAEPIEVPFGLWSRVGPRNHVLSGARIPREKRNFGETSPPARCKVEGISGMQLIYYLPYSVGGSSDAACRC